MRLRNPLLLFLAAAFFLPVADHPFARVEGDTPTSHTFQLHYREKLCENGSDSGGGMLLKMLPHPTPFAKEPVLGNASFFRGVIHLPKRPSQSVGFIWDKINVRLYLDTNRNGDLTDDSSNPVQGKRGAFSQDFNNIHVDSIQGAQYGRWNTCVFFVESAPLFGSMAVAEVTSGWCGEIELADRKWEMAVQDDLDGEIGPGDRMFLEEPGFFKIPRRPGDQTIVLLREQFTLAPRAWLNGKPYDLAFHLNPGDEGGILTVTFQETTAPSQECEIAGTDIARLDFRQGTYGGNTTGTVAVFQRPGRLIRVAPGEYRPQIHLDGGPRLGMLFSDGRGLTVEVKSDPTSCPLLNFGGPVRPEIRATRDRSSIYLTYALQGVGAEKYETDGTSATLPLHLTISKGNRELASADLEPG